MPNFIKNPALLVTIGAALVFVICSMFFSPDALSDATATVMMVACAAGLWRWGPTGWRVYWKGAHRTEDWGILAVCALFLAIIVGRLYGIVYRQLERPEWLQDSYWSPFLLYVLLGAVVLLVAATKDPRD